MKIIYNYLIPFSGFKAINLFGILFARKGANINERTLNHERIHSEQMRELLFVPFYLLYIIEFIIRIPMSDFDVHKAYRNISFEREAFANDENFEYLKTRKLFSAFKYLKSNFKN